MRERKMSSNLRDSRLNLNTTSLKVGSLSLSKPMIIPSISRKSSEQIGTTS